MYFRNKSFLERRNPKTKIFLRFLTPEILSEAKGRRREIPFETVRGEETQKEAEETFAKPNLTDPIRRKKPNTSQEIGEENSVAPVTNPTVQIQNEEAETGRSENVNTLKPEETDEDQLLEAELGRDSDSEQNGGYNNHSDSLFEDCDKMEE